MASTINATPTSSGLIQTADSTGVLALQTGGTTAVTISATQNVGVGTTNTGLGKLTAQGTITAKASADESILSLSNNGSEAIISSSYGSTGTYCPMVFKTSDAERMRIDSSGNVLVNTTANFAGAGGKIAISTDTGAASGTSIKDTGTTYGANYQYITFVNAAGTNIAAIQHNASTTVNYATSSDARLKKDLGIAISTEVIDNIIIHNFEWKEDGRIDRGVFAQEANEIKPSAISVGTDELTESGELLKPWGVDYSKFVPELIVYCQQLKKTAQEQQAIITEQANAITALEARLTALEIK